MDPRNDQASSRTLPPLVEGKVHGYLRLVIDEIVWSRRSPGNVTVIASWWGELDSAQFRPADIRSGESRPESDTTETYTIRANPELFQEYLKNCETLELVVISEKNHQVVGTARVAELSNLLDGKPYFRYIPILNDNGSRTGDLHVTMKLTIVPKKLKSPTKKPANSPKISVGGPRRSNVETLASFPYENDVAVAIKNAKQNENVYRSILKERRSDVAESKSLAGVNDKLVAQVVARAQRLRGAILKETGDEDPLALSEGSSSNDSFRSDRSINDEANLYEYFLGKKMSRREETRALDVLRATSPTPILIDLAAETIRSCRNEKNAPTRTERKISLDNVTRAVGDISQTVESSRIRPRETLPADHVDSLRIAVESLTLSPAGFRRVRSSCLSRGDGIPLSVTYFVQYDSNFGNTKTFNRKIIDKSRPVKLSSKKQVGQVICFNHEAVYDLSKTYLRTDVPLKFKIFNRHLNQRTPTELGIGSICVADASRSRSLSSTQRLAIVNKGIKIGELKVTVELGCDRIHFGKQFVEAVTSAKENIPVLEVSSVSSLETPRYRTATGSESKENAKPSSSSGNKPDNSWSFGNVDRTGRQEESQRGEPDERGSQQEEPRRERDDSVLLYGLIYVDQGKDLPFFNTYLICRGFWREDRAISRVCGETNNPFYNFHQLVPLMHGQDLLERTRNNCVVVEVYSRRANGVDELLGISKLSLHRLYVAYRDPQVLLHLLSSKYPVISVDEWVSVSHPVTARPCGQIHALVALGTADQIALLEMTRGLRDSGAPSRHVGDPPRTRDELPRSTCELVAGARFSRDHEIPLIREERREYDNYRSNRENTEERNTKSASCQTEITTVKCFKRSSEVEDELTGDNPQSRVLNVIVDRLAQALNAPKSSADRAAQTEIDFPVRNSCDAAAKIHDVEPLNLNPSTNISFSGDSGSDDADSQRGHFFPSREIYRSVGVGAEFDDPVNPGPSTSYADTSSIAITNGFAQSNQTNVRQRKNESPETEFNREIPHAIASLGLPNSMTSEAPDSGRSENEGSSFRAVVEIECALHLPRVEKMDDTVEPCTYVTFQRARSPNETQYGCYILTHLFPFSCSPKWDWRCDTRLSSDLLENEEKRLILKVWRLVNPETSMEINLERDIVIGFAAIDVSVLTVGFPVVSGWFHVMDFTGKCNGQIKVSVTPLDNIAAFGKIPCQSIASRPALPDFEYSNSSSPYHADARDSGQLPNSGCSNVQENTTNRNEAEHEPVLDMGINLGDASMSFLSLSLKQKLTELDEIKKRLQTRLQDVTNTAFDDDYDNDFDSPIVDEEDANNGNSDDVSGNVPRGARNWRSSGERAADSSAMEAIPMTNGDRPRGPDGFEAVCAASNSNSDSFEANCTDTGYSTGSNVRSSRHFSNGNRYPKNDDNRFRSLHSPSGNIPNGYDCPAMYTNGRCPDQTWTNQNRTTAQNVRNYRSCETEVSNYRGSCETIARNVETDGCEANEEHPIRGTRMHISHLLDKLTSQLTAVPPSTANQSTNKRNIMDLITSLRRNNNFTNDTKCNREVNVRTVPTQTEINHHRETPLTRMSDDSTEIRENVLSNEMNSDDTRTSGITELRNRKVSSVVREELAADDGNETPDELSSHLMTTNVRHADLRSMINPLLYRHVIPDVRACANGETTNISRNDASNVPSSTEVEAIERMDTRYAKNFDTTVDNGLGRLRNLTETESTSWPAATDAAISENDEIFRMTPSGISDNIDGNIDVTVIHKPCNDDLMASNSVDSTTTISLAGNDYSQNATENDDNSSLNSTETSVSGVSRQAPDGGNPVEESVASAVSKTQVYSRDSSSTS